MGGKHVEIRKCICLKDFKDFYYRNSKGEYYLFKVGEICDYIVEYKYTTIYYVNNEILGIHKFEEYFMDLDDYRKIKLNKILNG